MLWQTEAGRPAVWSNRSSIFKFKLLDKRGANERVAVLGAAVCRSNDHMHKMRACNA